MSLEFRVIDIETRDPYLIDGIDEAIYQSVESGRSPPTLVFHSWEPSVTISRNQRLSDLNLEACKKNGYNIIRMRTGGRAVVHHPDNDFSYSLFVPVDHFRGQFGFVPRENPKKVYDIYCKRIADALITLGLPAELKNKNDLYVRGKKLSGNAQRISEKIMMQQGIIIYQMPNLKLTLSLMNPNLYDKNSVNELGEIMTSIDQYNKNLSRKDVVDAIAYSLTGGYDLKWDNLTKSELEVARNFSKIPLDGNEENYTVRGLCWLPRGLGLGTYKGENPDA